MKADEETIPEGGKADDESIPEGWKADEENIHEGWKKNHNKSDIRFYFVIDGKSNILHCENKTSQEEEKKQSRMNKLRKKMTDNSQDKLVAIVGPKYRQK